ncbi:MAG TPA: hypothetical protein VN908_07690 [Gemmatimonadales bacterium]|nr:hypothetical protein [Gemmatimonadales bacterium]
MTAGTASATSTTPTTIDRSDFRHILVSGTKVGVAMAGAVIVFLAVSRLVPAGTVRALLQTIVVLAAGVAASLLPAYWATARTTQGIASAAAIGLWGTIVFMAIDIILLRPFHAFPWTWDAIGGGSTWWYLPIWWMLGTFVAWMGGLVTAGRAAPGGAGDVSIQALALPLVIGAAVLALAVALLRLGIYLPVAAGAGFTLVLTVFAVVAIARKT